MRLASALIIGALCAQEASAQVRHNECMAPDTFGTGTRWGRIVSDSAGSSRVPTVAVVRNVLAGEYDVVLFVTEGIPTPIVRKWRLRLVPVDSSQERPLFGPPNGPRTVLTGTRVDTVPVTADSLLRVRKFQSTDDVEMRLHVSTGQLEWRTEPGGMDVGLHFWVREVFDWGFYGRWEDGTIAIRLFQRDGINVAEKIRGYYCARRRS